MAGRDSKSASPKLCQWTSMAAESEKIREKKAVKPDWLKAVRIAWNAGIMTAIEPTKAAEKTISLLTVLNLFSL